MIDKVISYELCVAQELIQSSSGANMKKVDSILIPNLYTVRWCSLWINHHSHQLSKLAENHMVDCSKLVLWTAVSKTICSTAPLVSGILIS